MNDCFAYNTLRGRCNILNDAECADCAFYKTKAQLQEERRKCMKRISKLSVLTQAYLQDKYCLRKFSIDKIK